MSLRDYVRSVRETFHREPPSQVATSATSAAQAANGEGSSDGPRWALRGDLPSNKIFIPDACLATLTSTVLRPPDKMTGVITALHGALGAPRGYSVVQVALYAHVRLVQTSKQGTSYNNIIYGGGMMMPAPRTHNIDAFEERVIKVAGDTLYNYREEGMKEGKKVILPFRLSIPSEAEDFQLAPSLTTFM